MWVIAVAEEHAFVAGGFFVFADAAGLVGGVSELTTMRDELRGRDSGGGARELRAGAGDVMWRVKRVRSRWIGGQIR